MLKIKETLHIEIKEIEGLYTLTLHSSLRSMTDWWSKMVKGWERCGKMGRFQKDQDSSRPSPVTGAWGKLGWTLMLNAAISIIYTFTFLAPILLIVARKQKSPSMDGQESNLRKLCRTYQDIPQYSSTTGELLLLVIIHWFFSRWKQTCRVVIAEVVNRFGIVCGLDHFLSLASGSSEAFNTSMWQKCVPAEMDSPATTSLH